MPPSKTTFFADWADDCFIPGDPPVVKFSAPPAPAQTPHPVAAPIVATSPRKEVAPMSTKPTAAQKAKAHTDIATEALLDLQHSLEVIVGQFDKALKAHQAAGSTGHAPFKRKAAADRALAILKEAHAAKAENFSVEQTANSLRGLLTDL